VPTAVLRRAAVLLALGSATVLLTALPAAAHVTVSPSSVPGGSDATLTFTVPTEKDNASTTKVEIAMPEGQPIASVAAAAVPGWTVQVTKSKLAKPVQSDDGPVTEAVSRVTWTASPAAAIKPDQFALFSISAGPMPTTGKVLFKTLQTYSDGDVVRWIQAQTGAEEPANPAPAVTLTAGDEGSASPSPSAAASPSVSASAGGGAGSSSTNAASTSAPSDSTSRGLAIAGLVAGLIALLLAAAAFVVARRRQPVAPTADHG
jgi:uncharacterized protein YcnI